MEKLIEMFKALIAWFNELHATFKKFAAGFEEDFPNMTGEL